MKKVIVLGLFLCLGVVGAKAQSASEIGIRFGSFSGNNVALDAIVGVGEFSRIHANASFGSGMGIDLLWDFIYKPLADSGLDWYTGVGPYTYIPFDGGDFALGAIGEVGLAYTFDFPMSISIDARPGLEIISNTSFYIGGGFNVRYVFGK